MCVTNSAHSQIAEALAKAQFGENARVQSAGSAPTALDPDAIKVMSEIGIDISNTRAKLFDHLSPHFIEHVNYVIILCNDAITPVLTGAHAKVIRWPMQDPEHIGSTSVEKIQVLRQIRDSLKQRLSEFAKEVNVAGQPIDVATV